MTNFDNFDTDYLVELLREYENVHDMINVEKIYTILNTRDIKADFWRECFYDTRKWIVKIVRKCKNPLSIHDVILIQDDDLFYDTLQKFSVSMDNISIWEMFDQGECFTKSRFEAICKKLPSNKLNKSIEFMKEQIEDEDEDNHNRNILNMLLKEMENRK